MKKMKTKVFLICFTGIDGSGKTTLSKELVKLLNRKGVKCKYVYGKLNPFISKPFILIGREIFLRGKNPFKDYSEYSNSKRRVIMKHYFLSRIYQKILLFDYMLQIFFKIKLPLMLDKNIVCDRYVYDTIITDIAIDMYSKGRIIKLLNNLQHFFPDPDITFLVDLPEEIAYKRKDDIPSIDYLKERRKIYLEVGEKFGMVVLDGSKSLEELRKEIQKYLTVIINKL